MSDCCGSNGIGCESQKKNKTFPRKFACPANSKDYIAVSHKTILHHIKAPWGKELPEQQYYFCDDPECDVVYFGLEGSVIKKAELRTRVGVKEKNDDMLICYCFGVSKAAAKQQPEIKTYVSQNTKESLCACDIRNPSGRCCLKDFPKKTTVN